MTKFYASLFGWSVSKDNALGYREIKTGDAQGIDGGVWPAPPEAPNFVQLFIEVDDADATITKATGLGARVLVPKSALPDGDALAILQLLRRRPTSDPAHARMSMSAIRFAASA